MSVNFIDTNIIVYSLGNEAFKQDVALQLLSKHPVISVQVLSETANVMKRKLAFNSGQISTIIERIALECIKVSPISFSTLISALQLSSRYQFSHYDSLIVASALKTNCTQLFTEDMHHDLVVNKTLTIINPFK